MLNRTAMTLILSVAFLFGAAACGPSLIIQNVDYSQPLESVLTPDDDAMVQDQRFAIKFSISSILEEEGISSVDEVRLIRNREGYYFVTAAGFSNVYVLQPDDSELKLSKKIRISGDSLGQPAFNQRGDYIELIDNETGMTYNLDHN